MILHCALLHCVQWYGLWSFSFSCMYNVLYLLTSLWLPQKSVPFSPVFACNVREYLVMYYMTLRMVMPSGYSSLWQGLEE